MNKNRKPAKDCLNTCGYACMCIIYFIDTYIHISCFFLSTNVHHTIETVLRIFNCSFASKSKIGKLIVGHESYIYIYMYIYYKYHIHSYPICKDCYRSLFQPPETTINDGWRKFLEVEARFVDVFNLIAINEAHEILTSQRTWWEWLISKVLTSLKAFRCFLEMIPALLCGEPVLLKMHQSQCKYDLSVSQPFHSKVSMAPESWVLNDWHLQFPLSLLPGSRLWPSACQAVTQPAAAWSPRILGIWRMVHVFKCRLAKPTDFRASSQDANGISPSPPRPSPLLVPYHLSPSGWKRPEKNGWKMRSFKANLQNAGKITYNNAVDPHCTYK